MGMLNLNGIIIYGIEKFQKSTEVSGLQEYQISCVLWSFKATFTGAF